MSFLIGKRALIFGVASKLSIAYGIANALSSQGCELALTYQTQRFKDRVINTIFLIPNDLIICAPIP